MSDGNEHTIAAVGSLSGSVRWPWWDARCGRWSAAGVWLWMVSQYFWSHPVSYSNQHSAVPMQSVTSTMV